MRDERGPESGGDRPRFIQRSEPLTTPEAMKRNRSNAMLVFAVLAFAVGAVGLSKGAPGGLIFGILGVGLLVGGLVIRP